MIKLAIKNIGVYNHREDGIQKSNAFFLVYHVRGLKRLISWHPDGKIIYSDKQDPGPYLSIVAPDTTTNFCYGSSRENWVIIFDTAAIRYCSRQSSIEICQDGNWLPIPTRIPVRQDRVAFWNLEFRELCSQYKTATPKSLLAAELGTLNILRHFLTAVEPSNEQNHAARIKTAIDADSTFRLNFSEISEQCGYGRDHARRLFKQVYHINPLAYRKQRRINQIMALIADSNLSITDIASKTGFQYLSHLTKFIKTETGQTPTELIRLYRKLM